MGAFNRLDEMTPESIGGQRDEYSPVSYLRLPVFALRSDIKPLDTKPHGSRIAALRRSDHGPNDGVPIIFEEFFPKLRDASAGAFRLTARVPGQEK
jgi:hypothetical protein